MNYLNKLLLCLLLLFSLCSCKEKEEDPVIDEGIKYIEPATEHLFSLIKKDLRQDLYFANSGEVIDDYKLQMWGIQLPEVVVKDINGNDVDFNDLKDKKVFFEIVQDFCGHCKYQLEHHHKEIVENNPDVTFIQFFYVGEVDTIKQFYADIDMEFDDKTIIIPRCQELRDFVSQLGVESTPFFALFNNGILTWSEDYELTASGFARCKEFAFEKTLAKDDFVTDNGISIFEAKRMPEDVYNDLTIEKQQFLDSITNSTNTKELSLKYMGRKLDYSDISKGDSDAYSEIKDFKTYKNKDVVFMYTYFSGNQLEDLAVIDTYNRIISQNQNLEFVVIVDEYSMSNIDNYFALNKKINCPVMSNNADLPEQLFDIDGDIYTFPTAFIVEKGTITGAIEAFVNAGEFEDYIKYFIGEGAIARLD